MRVRQQASNPHQSSGKKQDPRLGLCPPAGRGWNPKSSSRWSSFAPECVFCARIRGVRRPGWDAFSPDWPGPRARKNGPKSPKTVPGRSGTGTCGVRCPRPWRGSAPTTCGLPFGRLLPTVHPWLVFGGPIRPRSGPTVQTPTLALSQADGPDHDPGGASALGQPPLRVAAALQSGPNTLPGTASVRRTPVWPHFEFSGGLCAPPQMGAKPKTSNLTIFAQVTPDRLGCLWMGV